MPSRKNGSPDAGLAVFVESIRWLNVRWGMGRCRKGLRRCGFAGRFEYWRWHSTWRAMLVLPALMDRRLLEEEARRLAAHLAAARKHSARRAIYLFGYSCGAYVALRALELLPAGVEVEAAGLLAPAFRPGRDLGPALAHVRGRIVCVSSLADCLILGAGTLVFGTADRAHAPSAGMVGLRHSSARDGRVVQVRWHPAMAALGWFGSHFTAAAPGLIANRVALAMGIACPQTGIL